MKRICIIIAICALGLCACDKVNLKNETSKTQKVYHFNLRASFDAQTKGVTFDPDGESISSQFATTDKVYVYNKTKGAFARYYDSAEEKYLLSALHPSNLSSSGQICDLEGDLSFYRLDGSDEWESVTVEAGDIYDLFYQMNDPDYFELPTVPIPRFDYSLQDGSATGASNCDFAEATGIKLVLSGTTLTVPKGVRFENLQSIFRQRLSFTNGGVAVTPMPTITKLTIGTSNNTALVYDRPDRPKDPTYDGDTNIRFWAFSIDIDNPVLTSDGDVFLSLAFYYTNENPATGDKLILTAIDNEGNIYQGTKDVPSGGFHNSRYYYGSCEMVWQYRSVKPAVTRSDGGDVVNPNNDGWYIFDSSSSDQFVITISGNSEDYRFYFENKPAIVTLTGSGNPVSASWSGNSAFIESEKDLTIVLGCNYVIDNSAEYEKAIECTETGFANGGALKLATTGGPQTLTVITNDDGTFAEGIFGDSNYNAWTATDVANLAADGFIVTRSSDSPIDNDDGTYTWVYTVAPTP